MVSDETPLKVESIVAMATSLLASSAGARSRTRPPPRAEMTLPASRRIPSAEVNVTLPAPSSASTPVPISIDPPRAVAVEASACRAPLPVSSTPLPP